MSYIGNEPIVSATRTVTEITATAGQTTFTANGGYTVGYIDVFVNGAQLQSADFTATNGSTVVLTQAAQVGDVVRLVAWGTFNTSSVQGNLAFTGTGNRITGDFSNSTIPSRVMFQSNTTNGNTAVFAIPNGTSQVSNFSAVNNSDPTNAGTTQILASSTESQVRADRTGTGTYLPLTMYTGGSERLRIDTSGNVGIGTNSPSTYDGKLTVFNGNLTLTSTGNKLYLYYNSATNHANLSTSAGGDITFTTGTSSPTERMRITPGGAVLIGTTNADPAVATGVVVQIGNTGFIQQGIDTNTNSNHFLLYNKNATNNGYRFYVNANGGIYNFSGNNVNLSDERSKTNIELSGNYLDKICAIPVKLFNYKDEAEGEQKTLGVIAQDVEAVAPEFVNNDGWEGIEPEDGVPLKTIYSTDLMFGMMKAIQELKTIVDNQKLELDNAKAEIELLKGAN